MYLDQSDTLSVLREWVAIGAPFIHVRFNDGECASMFRLRPSEEMTSGEHVFYQGLGEALLATLSDLCHVSLSEPSRNILIGTHQWTNPDNPTLGPLITFLLEHGWLGREIPWVIGDFWYDTRLEQNHQHCGHELLRLFDAIRSASEKRPVILLSNPVIADARFCLGANYIEIPRVNAWDAREEIERKASEYPNGLFVWCGGLPAKVLAYRVYSKCPASSHIDAGAVFDGVFGIRNRAWLERGSGTHWDFLHRVLTPYVQG